MIFQHVCNKTSTTTTYALALYYIVIIYFSYTYTERGDNCKYEAFHSKKKRRNSNKKVRKK